MVIHGVENRRTHLTSRCGEWNTMFSNEDNVIPLALTATLDSELYFHHCMRRLTSYL